MAATSPTTPLTHFEAIQRGLDAIEADRHFDLDQCWGEWNDENPPFGNGRYSSRELDAWSALSSDIYARYKGYEADINAHHDARLTTLCNQVTRLEDRIFFHTSNFSDIDEERSDALYDNMCDHDAAIPWYLKTGAELSDEQEEELARINLRFNASKDRINARFDAHYASRFEAFRDEFVRHKDQICTEFLAENPGFEEDFWAQEAEDAAQDELDYAMGGTGAAAAPVSTPVEAAEPLLLVHPEIMRITRHRARIASASALSGDTSCKGIFWDEEGYDVAKQLVFGASEA